MPFKTVRLTTIHFEPKRTISISGGGLGRLQMVSEPNARRCASKDARPPRGVDCEIPHQLERERSIPYKGVETSSLQARFKTVRLTAIRNESKQTISISGGSGLLQV